MKILVVGGTGFAGSHIAKEAARRGHELVSLGRTEPQEKVEGVSYVIGSALDADLRGQLVGDADVVVAAISPRGDMLGKLGPIYADLAGEAAAHDARLVVIGGFTSLRPAPGAPRFYDGGEVPEEYRPEIEEMIGVLDRLQSDAPENLRWVYVSPAANFGAQLDVADHGKPRQGGDVAIFNAAGESLISGSDFAIGVVDEIEAAAHDGENISFAQAEV